MTIAEKLRGIAQIAEQDETDLGRVKWRLLALVDDIDREQAAKDGSFIDSLINKPTNLEAA